MFSIDPAGHDASNTNPLDRLTCDPILQSSPILLAFTEVLCARHNLTDDDGVERVLGLLRGLDADSLWLRVAAPAIDAFAEILRHDGDHPADTDDLDPAIIVLAENHADAEEIELALVLDRASRLGSDAIWECTGGPAVDELEIALGVPS